MRRERRNVKKNNSNTSVFIIGGVLILAIATFIVTFVVYSNKLALIGFILSIEKKITSIF